MQSPPTPTPPHYQHTAFSLEPPPTLSCYTNLSGGGLSISCGVCALAVGLSTTEVIGVQEEGRNRKQTHLVK